MPDCVVCSKSRLPKQLHTFTSKARLREQWMTALTNDDSEKARLDITLRTAKARQLVCEDHFAEESFDITPNSRVLKVNAIPMSKVQLFISNSLYHTNKLSTISTIRPFSEGLADRNLPYSYSYCRQLASAHSLSLCFLPSSLFHSSGSSSSSSSPVPPSGRCTDPSVLSLLLQAGDC